MAKWKKILQFLQVFDLDGVKVAFKFGLQGVDVAGNYSRRLPTNILEAWG